MAYTGRGADDLNVVDEADDKLLEEGERLGQHLGSSKTYFREVLEKKTNDSVSLSYSWVQDPLSAPQYLSVEIRHSLSLQPKSIRKQISSWKTDAFGLEKHIKNQLENAQSIKESDFFAERDFDEAHVADVQRMISNLKSDIRAG